MEYIKFKDCKKKHFELHSSRFDFSILYIGFANDKGMILSDWCQKTKYQSTADVLDMSKVLKPPKHTIYGGIAALRLTPLPLTLAFLLLLLTKCLSLVSG